MDSITPLDELRSLIARRADAAAAFAVFTQDIALPHELTPTAADEARSSDAAAVAADEVATLDTAIDASVGAIDDDALIDAFEDANVDPDSAVAPVLRAEMERRGIGQ